MATTNNRRPNPKIKSSELDAYIEGLKQGIDITTAYIEGLNQGIDITTANLFYAHGYYRWFGEDRFQGMALTIYNNGKVIGNLSDHHGMYNQFMIEGEVIHVGDMTIINLLKRPTNAFYQFIKDGEDLVGRYEGRFGFNDSVWSIDPIKPSEIDYVAWLEIHNTLLDYREALKKDNFPGFKYIPQPDYVQEEMRSQLKELERQQYTFGEYYDDHDMEWTDMPVDHVYYEIFQNAEWHRIRQEIKADHEEAVSELLRDGQEILSDSIHDRLKYLKYSS